MCDPSLVSCALLEVSPFKCTTGTTTPNLDESDVLSRDGTASFRSFRLVEPGEVYPGSAPPEEEQEEEAPLFEDFHDLKVSPGVKPEGEAVLPITSALLLAHNSCIAWPQVTAPLGEPLCAPELACTLKEELAKEVKRVLDGCSGAEAWPPGPPLAEDFPEPPTTTMACADGPPVESSRSCLSTELTSSSSSSESELRETLIRRLYTQLVEAASGMAMGCIMQAIETVVPSLNCTSSLSCMGHEMLAKNEGATELEIGLEDIDRDTEAEVIAPRDVNNT